MKAKRLFLLLFINGQILIYNSNLFAQCTGAVANTGGTTSITPTTSWQTVVFKSGDVRYIEFAATTGNTYFFSCEAPVGGSAAGVDEQFSMLTTSNVAAGGVYSTSFLDAFGSGTKEVLAWSPSSNGTYRIVLSLYSGSNCQTLASDYTVAYISFAETENYCYWTGGVSTSWSNGDNWYRRATTGYPTWSAPASTYNVTIPSGSSNQPNISSTTNADCDNLTINSGATLTNAATVLGLGDLDIYGNFTNNGTFNHTGDEWAELRSTGNLGGTGTFTTSKIYIYDETVTLTSSITIRDLKIYNDGVTFLNLGSNTLTVTNYLDQSGTLNLGTGTLEYAGTSANHTMNDSRFTESTGTFYYNATANAQTVKTGTYYNLKVRTNNGYTATVGEGSTFTVTNDLTFLNPGAAGGTASVSASTSITVNGNLYIGNSGNALTLDMNATRIKNTESDGTLYMGNVSGHAILLARILSTAINFEGFNSPVFYGTVTYDRAGDQIVTTGTYNSLTLAGGSGTKTLNGAIVVNGVLTISAGTTLDVASGSNYGITVGGNWVNNNVFTQRSGTVTFNNSSTISGTATTSFNSITISGTLTGVSSGNFNVGATFTNNGTFTHNSGTVTFNGTAAQTISGSTTTTFHDLAIANTSGNVALSVNSTVNGTLTMTSGDLVIATAKTLTIDDTDDPGISGGSSTTMIVTSGTATVEKTYTSTTAITFPLGNGTYYRPLTLTPSNANSTIWTVSYTNSGHSDTDVDGSGLNHISPSEYWTCNRGGGTPADAIMALTWHDGISVNDYANLRLAHYDGATDWDLVASSPVGDNNSGTLTSSAAVSVFSPFTIGSTNGNNPLPIELLSFDSECLDNEIHLTWSTASEINNDYFTLEKSADGNYFETLVTIDGSGTKNSISNYSFNDNATATGNVYYRLKQTDYDGKSEYFDIITENCGNAPENFVITPIKTSGSIEISYLGSETGRYTINISNHLGQLIYSGVHTFSENSKSEIPTQNFANGIYFIQIYNGVEVVSKKIIL